MMAMTAMAGEANDTTYVLLDFNKNPWNYPVREVTEGWRPDYSDYDSPGAILDETDFSWPVTEGSSEKIKVTLYPVDLDEYNKVSVFGRVDPGSEATSLGIAPGMVNVLYTQPGTTMRFEAPENYTFGKMVFYCFHSANFLVGDDYEEEFEYEYNGSTFKQKLKVWKPTSPFKNQYDYDIWQGDSTNILFNYPYFTAHFVKIDIRLVPTGQGGQSIKGDVNGDGAVDVADISAIISCMAGESGITNPLQQGGSADVNEDGAVDVADISSVITIMASK